MFRVGRNTPYGPQNHSAFREKEKNSLSLIEISACVIVTALADLNRISEVLLCAKLLPNSSSKLNLCL
jgi:hypothetical protein